MTPVQLLSAATKALRIYQLSCLPVRRQYEINQTAFDMVMFLANNPEHNTARDICHLRGIKSGMVSVTMEKLIAEGYLRREPDPRDRRVLRLFLNEKAEPLVRDGRRAQEAFGAALTARLTGEEKTAWLAVTEKLINTIDELNGGFWQHVTPAQTDENKGAADGAALCGPGTGTNLF